MIVKNKKVFLEEHIVGVNVPMNTKVTKIVADLIEENFIGYFEKYNMDININDVLFISDSVDKDYLIIDETDFERFSKIKDVLGETTNKFTVPTVHALKFTDPNFADSYFKEYGRPSLIVLGFINNVPEQSYDNIVNMLGGSRLMIFGDELVSSVELNDYYSDIMTNAEINIVYSYSENKLSPFKKINSLLYKLRDKKTQTLDSVPNNSANIQKLRDDCIDLDLITNKLYLGHHVVLPRRFFASVNSKVHNMLSTSSTLSLKFGESFYTRFPYYHPVNEDDVSELHKGGDVIPALSRVTMQSIDVECTYEDNGRIYKLKDVLFTKPNGEIVRAKNVPIDYTGFLLNFDPNEHLDNYDEFDNIENHDPNICDPNALSLIPFKIFTKVEQKYVTTYDMLLFKETHDLETYMTRHRNSWYQEMCNTIDTLHIIHDTNFNEL